jgi:hypothetical protein
MDFGFTFISHDDRRMDGHSRAESPIDNAQNLRRMFLSGSSGHTPWQRAMIQPDAGDNELAL